MNRLRTVLAALILAAAATQAGAHGAAAGASFAAGGAAIGSRASTSATAVQSQAQLALAAREGYGNAEASDLGLLEYTRPEPRLPEWRLEKLRAFTAEVVQRQAADGGTLSESDRAYLHAKLSRILVP